VTAAQAAASSVTEEDAVSVQVAAVTKMSVTEPAAQVAQAVDESSSSSYLPTAHEVQVVAADVAAPLPTPTSVREPAAQSAHDVDESPSSSYLPAAHAVHVVLSAASTAAA
jgi:hypothetical protein